MKNYRKIMVFVAVFAAITAIMASFACAEEVEAGVEAVQKVADNSVSMKAIAAAVTVALAAAAGAFSMGHAISKSVDSIARQPEAESKIRTTLMLGLVFIETAIIYALIVAVLIIFVL